MNHTANKKHKQQGIIWNILGSGMNAALTMIIGILAARFIGEEGSGIVSLGLAAGYIFYPVGTFEVRPYQVTDLQEKNSFSEYFATRILTGSIMLLSIFVYTAYHYTTGSFYLEKFLCVLFLCLFKWITSFSDVFQGMFQQHERMDQAGQSMFFSITTGLTFFLILLIFTKSLPLSSFGLFIGALLSFILYDLRLAKKHVSIRPSFSYQSIKNILIICAPLFLSCFMNIFNTNYPRLIVEKYAENLHGIWNALYTPAPIINLLSLFIFYPFITSMAKLWQNKGGKEFAIKIFKIASALLFASVFVLIGAWFLGIPVLNVLYSFSLNKYKIELIIILLGGVCTALSTLLYYALTIMGTQHKMLIGESIAFILCIFITPRLVQTMHLHGAALSYLITMTTRLIAFLFLFIVKLHKVKKIS